MRRSDLPALLVSKVSVLIADPEVMELTNFVVGGNENETHYIDVNHKRDFSVSEIVTNPLGGGRGYLSDL